MTVHFSEGVCSVKQLAQKGMIAIRTRRDAPAWSLKSWRRVTVLIIIATLLGRAAILHIVSPFGLAFFVILYERSGSKRSWPALFAIVGAFSTGGVNAAFATMLQFVLYILVRRYIFRKKSPDLHFIPMTAAAVAIIGKFAMVGTVITRFDTIIAFTDGALVAILCLIFIQCMAMFIGHDYSKALRHEQMISLIILGGSVMMGLDGLTVLHYSVLDAATLWFVLMLACGGMGISAAGAIVVSLLTLLNHDGSLATVAITAFAGLLVGMLKDAPRILRIIALVCSVGVLTATNSTSLMSVLQAVVPTLAASLAYLLTPRRFLAEFAAYVPGTAEHVDAERGRIRRVQALLSEKIDEVGKVFDELSTTFADVGENPLLSAEQLVNHVVGEAAKQVCAGCPRRVKCWEKEGVQTYQAMVSTIAQVEAQTSRSSPTEALRSRCIRLDPIMNTLRHHVELAHRDARWIEKIREQKTLVAKQLSGVASVVRSIANEIEDANRTSLGGEEQILAALEQLGLYVDDVHIVSLEPGKVEIEIAQPTEGAYENSARVIAPLLSGILGENISTTLQKAAPSAPFTHTFASARLFDVKTAMTGVARDGRTISGDTHAATDLGNGRYAVAVSDGMGNGERARRESRAAIELLKRLLTAGFHEKLAIQTVNSTLLLRSQDEMFTTLDMALIDLFTARAEFLKIGSAPSFIRRGNQVRVISSANIPMGILQSIEVQAIDEELQAGDILILLSDGLYDAQRRLYDKEDWLKGQIERLETNDPQSIADTLIEAAIRLNHGEIHDDMTVLVAVIEHHMPEWAAIKLPGVVGLKKSGTKSRGA